MIAKSNKTVCSARKHTHLSERHLSTPAMGHVNAQFSAVYMKMLGVYATLSGAPT